MDKEQQARAVLARIIADNRANNFTGIDRSPAAIEKRRIRMTMASDPNSKFGGKPEGIGLELEQHVINGDLTGNQSVEVLMALYGLQQG